MTMRSFRKNYQVINEPEMMRCISSHKLDSYRKFYADGSTQRALNLYMITQMHSSFLFTPLQYLEITLRNKTYYSIRDFYAASPNILSEYDPNRWMSWLPQAQTTKDIVEAAEKKAISEVSGREIHEGDVISRLSFGTWVSLLKEQPNSKSRLHFWTYVSRKIFPNAPKRKQSFVSHRLKEINFLRNRLFHFEPVWDTRDCKKSMDIFNSIEKKYGIVMDTIQWMSSDIVFMLKEMGYTNFVERTFREAKKNLTGLFAP